MPWWPPGASDEGKAFMIKFQVQIPLEPTLPSQPRLLPWLGKVSCWRRLGKTVQWTPEESDQLLALPFLAGSLPVASRYLLIISSWVLAEHGWYLEYSMVYSPFPCRVGKRKWGWAMCSPAEHTPPACEVTPRDPLQSHPNKTPQVQKDCLARNYTALVWFWSPAAAAMDMMVQLTQTYRIKQVLAKRSRRTHLCARSQLGGISKHIVQRHLQSKHICL